MNIKFNCGNLPSGVYFYILQAEDFIKTKKKVLMKKQNNLVYLDSAIITKLEFLARFLAIDLVVPVPFSRSTNA